MKIQCPNCNVQPVKLSAKIKREEHFTIIPNAMEGLRVRRKQCCTVPITCAHEYNLIVLVCDHCDSQIETTLATRPLYEAAHLMMMEEGVV